MKTLLAILLSFVISEAPVFAIHGGYTLSGSQAVTGSYAGVLVPTSTSYNPIVPSSDQFGANFLGLFTLPIPTTGVGTGVVVLFANGSTFTGSIEALPNPNSDTGITGVLNLQFDYDYYLEYSGSVTTEAITATAQGPFDASTAQDTESSGGLGVDLTGTATLNISNGNVSTTALNFIVDETVVFAVEGYEDSTSASSSQ